MEAKKLTLLLLCLLCAAGIFAQNKLYKKAVFRSGPDSLQYRVMYPEGFSTSEDYPVVLFLHGSGERGNDNSKQLTHGSALFSKAENREKFPAIVIFPQCPANDYWAKVEVDRSVQPLDFKYHYEEAPTKPLDLTIQLMDSLLSEPYVKKDQVYVMGLSMGGMGTFEILYRRPEMFAAAIPICGGGDTNAAKEYATKVPLWIFHGARDNVVDPLLSVTMASSILEYGGYPNLTLYSDANHNSWDPAFKEPGLLAWLFSNTSKSKNGKTTD
ncbi:prolyl oligopeptidase family serine peptidase [Zeaxanthinibacter enoshimensis]|uniref:carboxylesterase family protein n=1 Tax=Zeaxanthinibacter enoshimensis TaxID=392009 RepID=UPI00356710A8